MCHWPLVDWQAEYTKDLQVNRDSEAGKPPRGSLGCIHCSSVTLFSSRETMGPRGRERGRELRVSSELLRGHQKSSVECYVYMMGMKFWASLASQVLIQPDPNP